MYYDMTSRDITCRQIVLRRLWGWCCVSLQWLLLGWGTWYRISQVWNYGNGDFRTLSCVCVSCRTRSGRSGRFTVPVSRDTRSQTQLTSTHTHCQSLDVATGETHSHSPVLPSILPFPHSRVAVSVSSLAASSACAHCYGYITVTTNNMIKNRTIIHDIVSLRCIFNVVTQNQYYL